MNALLKKAVPVLPAVSISDTVFFYESRLGFTGKNYGNYAILQYKSTEIHLFMASREVVSRCVGCLFLVDNVEDLYAQLTAKGLVQIKGQLAENPWGFKEFTVHDNNQVPLRFAQQR